MKGLVAEAYQMKLGKNQSNMLKGDKAITALTDAMKKGSVKTAELIPFLDKLMRRDAAPGVEKARTSAQAEQNRFENQTSKGWDNFTKGGGETGLAFFWRMMQKMGTWWTSNASGIGRAFETTMYWLDAFRLGVYEFAQFVSTGQGNSFTDWLKGLGLDVDSIYVAFGDLKAAIMQLLGLDSNSASTNLQILGERLVTFVNSLANIVRSVEQVINGLNQIKVGVVTNQQKYGEGTTFADRTRNALGDIGSNLMRYTPFAKFFNYDKNTISGGLSTVVGGITGGTANAAGSLSDLALGGGQYALPINPTQNGWTPTAPQDISTGMTRKSDYGSSTQNVNVKLEVQGNAEVINALIDDRTRAQFPVFLSQELTKAIVQAPKQ